MSASGSDRERKFIRQADDTCIRASPHETEYDRLLVMSAAPPNDTHPTIEAFLIEGYRKMSPAQKLERVRALTRAVQELALLDVRRRHPEADAREQALRVASRWIEPDLMARAFGWDVREVGY